MFYHLKSIPLELKYSEEAKQYVLCPDKTLSNVRICQGGKE
jgi:hypothetical protein